MRLTDGGLPAASRARGRVDVGIENTDQHPQWDAFVERMPGAEIVQTSHWARLKARTGSTAERIVVRDAYGAIVAGVQLLMRRVRGVGAFAYAPYGPVVAPEAPDEHIDLLVAHMIDTARRTRVRALFVQPPEHGARTAERLRAAGFDASDADVAPSATLRIDVRVSNDELLARMMKHARADMRRCMRQPLRVRVGTRDDLASFAELHANSAARQGFTPMSLPYLEALWNELAPSHAVIFLVDTDGVDLAAMLLTTFGTHVSSRLGGFAPERLPGRLRAHEPLNWAAITLARHRGIPWYDLGGIDRTAAVALASGVSRREPHLHEGPWGHKIVLGGTPVVLPPPMQFIPSRVLRVGYGAVRTNKSAHRAIHSMQRALRVASATTRREGA